MTAKIEQKTKQERPFEFTKEDLETLLYYHQDLLAELKENNYRPLRYYDHEDHYRRLREKRGDMPTDEHNILVDRLKQDILWYLHGRDFRVQRELNFYETSNFKEPPLYPELFVLEGDRPLGCSYQIGRDGPPPIFIIEIMSKKTWLEDIGPLPQHKPQRYEKWRVKEYFAYDPRPERPKSQQPQRLWGWRLIDDHYQPVQTEGEDGHMWSEQIESWLVPDGVNLKLLDRDGNLRVDKATYEERQKEQERQQKEQAQHRAERLAQRLRELGIDPDKLEQ